MGRARSTAVFTPLFTACALVVVGGGMAIYSGTVGLRFLPMLNIERPLLAELPPYVAPPTAPLAERVVLVIIDGLSHRKSYRLPLLDELRGVGIDARASSHAPTISRPNYVSIVTGVPPHASGVRNNTYRQPAPIDSLMDRVRAFGRQAAYVADSSTGFAQMFVQDFQDAHFAPWTNGFLTAGKLAVQRGFPLVVMLPGAVDDAGHAHGAASEAYRDAALTVDRELREVLSGLDLSRDAIVVTSDHGHMDGGGHGGMEREVVDVPLILAGAGVRAGSVLRTPRLIDVAPTVAALLGVPAPGHGLGRSLLEALEVDDGVKATLAAADKTRVQRNAEVVEAEVEIARERRDNKRVRRLSLVLAAVGVAVLALVLGTRLEAFLLGWQVLLISVPAFPLVFFALLETTGQEYSLSSLSDEGSSLRKVFYIGVTSMLVHVVVTWIALRGRVVLRDRLAAANAITLCGLLVASMPAALAWALYGGGPFVQLPGPKLLFLIPALYVAVACYAIAAAVSLGVELVVFFARAIDPRSPLRRAERRVARERLRLRANIRSAPHPDTPN